MKYKARKRMFALLCLVVIMASLSCSALAGTASSTTNGIKVVVSANNSNASCTATCSNATTTCAVLSVYDDSGSRIDYDINYSDDDDPTTAKAKSTVTNGCYVYGSSSAVVSGSYVSGPSKVKAYY